jgi:cGMP-dependent protein kinase
MGCLSSKPQEAGVVVGLSNRTSTVKGPSTSKTEEFISSQLDNRGKRNNVIALANLEDKDDAPEYSKTDEQMGIIMRIIKSPDAFFFTGLQDADVQIIIDATEPLKIPDKGNVVIKQGDPGDYFYIVEYGSFAAVINGQEKKTYGPGMFFGELALAYNQPRAATIVSTSTNGAVLRLESKVFRRVIAHSARDRYNAILSSLQKVPLLWNSQDPIQSNLNEQQLSKIAESVEIAKFDKMTDGKPTIIIKKGQMGKIFYMIKEGTVVVKMKETNKDLADVEITTGGYFGEQSLIRESVRNATIECKTDVVCLCISKDTFTQVLGPLQRVIDQNAMFRHLDAVDLFRNALTNKEKEIVYEAFELETVKKCTIVVKEGDMGDKFYLIKEGSCRIEKINLGKIPKVLTKGGFFGAGALLNTDGKREATIVANEDCEFLTLTRDTFSTLCNIKKVEARLKETEEKQKKENAALLTLHATEYMFSDLVRKAVLGSGTFGTVTLVQSKIDKKVYALKAMLKSEIVAHKQQENVIQEKTTMIVCNHPFILRLYQTFKDQYKLYMLLEFVQGGELFSVLHPAHPPRGVDGVTDRAAKFYAAGVLLGLAYMHNDKNIAYRDMKPENCLIDNQGYPKIVDFGFAKVITSKSYTLCGTPEYLAPELVLGRGHNKSVDYWAFGVMIYEMQAGYSPFSDPSQDQVAICKNIVKGNLKFDTNFDSDCKDLVKKLLNKDVQKRLGNLRNGTDDIKGHRWFKDYDWDGYMERQIKAPFKPTVRNPLDTSHFDPMAAEDRIEDKNYRDTSDWAKNF